MASHEIVAAIQALYPPLGRIPDPGYEPPSDATVEAEAILRDVLPLTRTPLPEGIQPGDGTSFPVDSVLVVEGAVPSAPKGPPAAMDVLAYYLPFHFYADGWGIYVRASGILSVAFMLGSASGRGLFGDLLKVASAILLQHERFHFFSELACSRAELVIEDELYRHYFHDRRATAIEEALCNAYVHRTALRGQPPQVRDQVKQWMLAQGPAYTAFRNCLSSSAFAQWCRLAANKMRGSYRGLWVSTASTRAGRITLTRKKPHQQTAQAPTEFLFAGLARAAAPTFLVRDVPSVGILRPFPKYAGMRILVHTHDHPPPHIHVEVPPGKEFARLTWPTLTPLRGDRTLSAQQRKSLDEYLSKYKAQIERKVQEVYPPR